MEIAALDSRIWQFSFNCANQTDFEVADNKIRVMPAMTGVHSNGIAYSRQYLSVMSNSLTIGQTKAQWYHRCQPQSVHRDQLVIWVRCCSKCAINEDCAAVSQNTSVVGGHKHSYTPIIIQMTEKWTVIPSARPLVLNNDLIDVGRCWWKTLFSFALQNWPNRLKCRNDAWPTITSKDHIVCVADWCARITLQSKQQINCSILPITVEPTFKGSIHWVSIKNEPPTHISVYYKWIIICHLSYSRISRSCETAKIEILLQAQNIRKPCVKRKLDVL